MYDNILMNERRMKGAKFRRLYLILYFESHEYILRIRSKRKSEEGQSSFRTNLNLIITKKQRLSVSNFWDLLTMTTISSISGIGLSAERSFSARRSGKRTELCSSVPILSACSSSHQKPPLTKSNCACLGFMMTPSAPFSTPARRCFFLVAMRMSFFKARVNLFVRQHLRRRFLTTALSLKPRNPNSSFSGRKICAWCLPQANPAQMSFFEDRRVRTNTLSPNPFSQSSIKFEIRSELKTFDDDWLKADTTVHLLTLFGWTIPSGVAIKAYGDTSLLGRVHTGSLRIRVLTVWTKHFTPCLAVLTLSSAAFTDTIGSNLANFPQGPALDDKFWLYLITWHIGLFSTMLLGQIGWQGRKQGYFKWTVWHHFETPTWAKSYFDTRVYHFKVISVWGAEGRGCNRVNAT